MSTLTGEAATGSPLAMSDYGPSTYGDRAAARYDDLFTHPPASKACIDLLADLAGKGPALELGVGTGRVARPLAARGVPVHGLDTFSFQAPGFYARMGYEQFGVMDGHPEGASRHFFQKRLARRGQTRFGSRTPARRR